MESPHIFHNYFNISHKSNDCQALLSNDHSGINKIHHSLALPVEHILNICQETRMTHIQAYIFYTKLIVRSNLLCKCIESNPLMLF